MAAWDKPPLIFRGGRLENGRHGVSNSSTNMFIRALHQSIKSMNLNRTIRRERSKRGEDGVEDQGINTLA
eukprot:5396137-Karenia_brevis.AAC.1